MKPSARAHVSHARSVGPPPRGQGQNEEERTAAILAANEGGIFIPPCCIGAPLTPALRPPTPTPGLLGGTTPPAGVVAALGKSGGGAGGERERVARAGRESQGGRGRGVVESSIGWPEGVVRRRCWASWRGVGEGIRKGRRRGQEEKERTSRTGSRGLPDGLGGVLSWLVVASRPRLLTPEKPCLAFNYLDRRDARRTGPRSTLLPFLFPTIRHSASPTTLGANGFVL